MTQELLFRGALLPLFGISWLSVVATASIFGILHLGSGRKYSFAVWATFVGIVYGYATILSSTVVVPMAAHAVNNLLGGIIWRYSQNRLHAGTNAKWPAVIATSVVLKTGRFTS
uniref:Prenyl-dependent CAAX protease n=1 Tax=Solanum tuberosum TaxID=4113 RepID=M1AQA9_SOLTU